MIWSQQKHSKVSMTYRNRGVSVDCCQYDSLGKVRTTTAQTNTQVEILLMKWNNSHNTCML